MPLTNTTDKAMVPAGTTAPTTREVATFGGIMGIQPRTLEEVQNIAKLFAASDLVPKEYQNKPGNVLVAMAQGYEVGLKPLQALQSIAVINGKPAVYGDAALALVRASGLLEEFVEFGPSEAAKKDRGWLRIKRKGYAAVEYEFTKADAQKANLWGKSGPWTQYAGRMLQMRNRAFALRDIFTDVLKGLSIAEEVQDFDMTMHPANDGKGGKVYEVPRVDPKPEPTTATTTVTPIPATTEAATTTAPEAIATTAESAAPAAAESKAFADLPDTKTPESDELCATIIIKDYKELTGKTSKGKPWTKYGVTDQEGDIYGTFSATDGASLKDAHAKGQRVTLLYKEEEKNGKTYRTITDGGVKVA